MTLLSLKLYSRKGCCLCEGLEQKLRRLPLGQLTPPLKLDVIDIDIEVLPKGEKERYDMRVPIMLLETGKMYSQHLIELPRVSPRLSDKALFEWLQKILLKTP